MVSSGITIIRITGDDIRQSIQVEDKLLGADMALTLCHNSDDGDLLRPWDVPATSDCCRWNTHRTGQNKNLEFLSKRTDRKLERLHAVFERISHHL